MKSRRRAQGFTLMELVVAIAISGVVVTFAAMFITAPVDAYAAQSRRARLLADAAMPWPRLQGDLRTALPNSVRWRDNGRYKVLEMLETRGFARYVTPPAASFDVAGTSRGIFSTEQVGDPQITNVFLSVNNAWQEAYTRTTSMTPALNITLADTAPVVAGHARLTLSAVPAINTNSPRNRVYLVEGFVAYLCDQTLGTITRYRGVGVVANVASHDTPAEFGGAEFEVIARGIVRCDFAEQRAPNLPQQVTARFTASRNNEILTVLHQASLENLP